MQRRLLHLRFGVVALGVVAFSGAVVFEANRLSASDEHHLRQQLDAQWATVRAYMRIANYRPEWMYDRSDPQEAATANRIRSGVYLVTDDHNRVLERSDAFPTVSLTTLDHEGVWFHRTDESGARYLLRKSALFDRSQQKPYYVVIGQPLTDDGRTRLYVLAGLSVMLLCALVAWAMVPLRKQEPA